MVTRIIKSVSDALSFHPAPAGPMDAVEAFDKVSRMLDTAWQPIHADVAERFLNRLLSRYHFTAEEMQSQLITGLRERIHTRRDELERSWNAMQGVAA